MAGSVNKVILVGNLGRDPEVRNTTGGQKIVQLSVATSESWKDKTSGERKDRTEWHRVVIFNENLASVAERFLTKGTKVYLEGQLQTRKWQDNEGKERYTTEVVLPRFRGELTILDSKGSASAPSNDDMADGGGDAASSFTPSNKSRAPVAAAGGGGAANLSATLDDDIPF